MGASSRPVIASALLLLLFSSLSFVQAHAPESYLAAHGDHAGIVDRLSALLGAEEPLLPADAATLVAAVKRACAAGPSHAQHQLGASDLVARYGQGEARVLDQTAVQQACAAIMACQLDDSCTLADAPGGVAGAGAVTNALRLGAALALLLEALAGVYIPVLLTSVEGYEWWLSLLNCFSGGVFLTTGLVHLLPHCAESQSRLDPELVGDYPLYLVLITLGYMLVLFVERVLFDVHGAAHGHGPHTGIVPPCVDCRTAEGGGPAGGSSASLEAAAGGDDSSGDGANGGPAALTPGRARYNLRSRGTAAPGADAAADSPGADALCTPLLAAAEPACGHHDHDHHSHGHGHGALHHGHGHSHGHTAHVPHHHHAVVAGSGDLRQGVILLVAMTVHTFLECMALGLMEQRKEFLMLFMAVASHKLISGLALSSRFLKEGATTKQITLCVGPFVLVAPTAILAGMFVRDVNPLVHLALSCFATGTFLYVGASEIVEEEFEGDMRSGRTDISQTYARWAKFGMLSLGVAAIALLSLVPDAHDHGGGHGHGHGAVHGHAHGHGHHHHHH